uniref:G_PROTEIN_RECEP_F1_2 domain-containing protein n=1 Tax=Steinernema glaseri TaxID=37863 RepID=A0A1I8AHK7_9BILA
MAVELETFYNVFLNSTFAHKTVLYVVTLYMVFTKTPPRMRVFSMFLLNLMFWDLGTHFLWMGFHPFPLMPLLCFRLDGFIASFYFTESLGHVFFIAFFVCIINVGTAISLSFQFRLFVIKHGNTMSKATKVYIVGYCIASHVIPTGFFVGLYFTCLVTVDEYPETIAPGARTRLFCYKPKAPESSLFFLSVVLYLMLTGVIVMILVVLSFREVAKNLSIIGERTAKMQKFFLRSLMILSGIPINIGGVPCIIMCFLFYFRETPYARFIIVICLLLASNYGPIVCIVTIVLFRPYRDSVVHIFKRPPWTTKEQWSHTPQCLESDYSGNPYTDTTVVHSNSNLAK